MIKYLQRNKEWIFSGCGVVLLVFVGQFIWRHLPTHQKSSPPSPALASSQRSQAAESSPLIAATPSPFVTPIPSSPVTFAEVIRVDMVYIHSGDIIRFRGVLEFIGPVHYIVAVNNCQLLEHHK